MQMMDPPPELPTAPSSASWQAIGYGNGAERAAIVGSGGLWVGDVVLWSSMAMNTIKQNLIGSIPEKYSIKYQPFTV